MRTKYFSVYDKPVGAFLPPFAARTVGEAERMFSTACSDPSHQFAKHSADYTMFYVGEFDDNSGIFHPCEPQRLLSAIECLGPDRVTAGSAALSQAFEQPGARGPGS